jgi:hypothetical protein
MGQTSFCSRQREIDVKGGLMEKLSTDFWFAFSKFLTNFLRSAVCGCLIICVIS